MEKVYYTYILSNKYRTVLYTGVTNNLIYRTKQHKDGEGSKFTKKYNVSLLVYFEIHNTIDDAIFREKQIKNYSRKKKEELVNKVNPEWKDLYRSLK